jgi:drug/metabolite transporter (DMT)-like permease
MHDVQALLSEHKQIIAAIIAGVFGVLAAFIKRPRVDHPHPAKNPARRMFLLAILALLLGAGMLAAEFFAVHLDPERDLSVDNPGLILCLAGCLLTSVGLIWTVINGLRLLTARKPPDPAAPATIIAPGTTTLNALPS